MSKSSSQKRSAGEWLFQLTTITIGVLIALSFDAVLRWNSDRILVREATRTIAVELADNKGNIERHLAALPERVAKFEAVSQLVDALLAGSKPASAEVELGLSLPELSEAGWQTAERTGALALMDYADVQRLAQLYAFQEFFVQRQQAMLEPLTRLGVRFTSRADPLSAPPKELEAFRADLLDFRGSLLLHEQLARQLGAAYATHATAVDAVRQ